MKRMSKRWVGSLAASSLVASGLALSTAPAGADVALPAQECTVASTVNILSYNDFHGRILDAAEFFSIVEQQRDIYGEENVLTISSGDDIGGSLFESMIDEDYPTLDILNAIELDVQAVGNHEFDKTWADLSGRVNSHVNFPQLGANVYDAGTTTVADPLLPSATFTVGGIDIAVIGAVTPSLPSLVDPSGISMLSIGNHVEAVNREAAAIADDVDFVIAAIHEGAGDGNAAPEANTGAAVFNDIYNNVSDDVDLIFNGHTHQLYDWVTPKGQPLLQAGQYAEHMNSVLLNVSAGGEVCSIETSQIAQPDEALIETPRIAEIREIIEAAEEVAEERGAVVIGEASEAISTPTGNADKRDVESTITNLVAQMFHDQLGAGDPNFIGVQNPGGTRDSFAAGDITYRDAALALPFANSLFTTEITGAQVKTMLEQQWQRQTDGTVPSRAFLRLGLSDNVTYTYDENLPEGERITSITVAGAPIDPEGVYTIGSGSFLIAGGDNFRVLAEGQNTQDSGRVDLEAWVDYVEQLAAEGPLVPDYSKRGVSAVADQSGGTATVALGDVLEDGVATDTLEMIVEEGPKVSPHVAAVSVTFTVDGTDYSFDVSDGAATIEIPSSVAGVSDLSVSVNLANSTSYDVLIPADWFEAADDDDDDDDDDDGGGKKPGLPSTGV